MNRKGQIGTQIGSLILLAIALIVGAIFIQAAAQNVGESTNTVYVNQSISTVVNGTAQYLTNVKSLSDVIVYNQTGASYVVNTGNYTITNNVVYNGQESVQIMPNADPTVKTAWRVTGTGQPLGYISDGGGRSIASLIILLMAVALVVIAAVSAMKAYNND